ncbi:unannotated protein [freshwater metagenome]|uniref:Unannotated protein n=1 Tax=freshwater metagenome TaxID=449393 RepID=A0A6J6P2Z6_9ZZZZ
MLRPLGSRYPQTHPRSALADLIAAAAATYGVAMALAPILQIRAILQHRTSKSVSVGYLQVLLVGFGLWLAYGIASHNAVIIIPNIVAVIVAAATIVVAYRFKPAKEQ